MHGDGQAPTGPPYPGRSDPRTLDRGPSGAEHPGVTARPPFDMTRPTPGTPPPSPDGDPSTAARSPDASSRAASGRAAGASRIDGPGPRGLPSAIEAALRGMSAPPAPLGLRERVLEAAASPSRVLPFVLPVRERGRILAMFGAAAAAAAIVFVVGGQLRAGARAPAPAWETLHPEAKSPPPRVRVVTDPARPDWTAASIVNASFDPLEGP